jgi:hypothetical protein
MTARRRRWPKRTDTDLDGPNMLRCRSQQHSWSATDRHGGCGSSIPRVSDCGLVGVAPGVERREPLGKADVAWDGMQWRHPLHPARQDGSNGATAANTLCPAKLIVPDDGASAPRMRDSRQCSLRGVSLDCASAGPQRSSVVAPRVPCFLPTEPCCLWARPPSLSVVRAMALGHGSALSASSPSPSPVHVLSPRFISVDRVAQSSDQAKFREWGELEDGEVDCCQDVRLSSIKLCRPLLALVQARTEQATPCMVTAPISTPLSR